TFSLATMNPAPKHNLVWGNHFLLRQSPGSAKIYAHKVVEGHQLYYLAKSGRGELFMNSERLYDRERVLPEDQQAVHERHQMAEGGARARRNVPHHPRRADLLDDPAERDQEVQAPGEGEAAEVGQAEGKAQERRRQGNRRVKKSKRREGEVKKRGDNKWFIRIFLGLDDAGMKRYKSKIVEGTRIEAEKQLRAFLSERDASMVVAPSAQTLDQHLDRWLEIAKIKIAERTAEDYKKFLAIYVRPELGSKRLSSLTTKDIQDVYTKMLERKLAPRTVQYVHTILQASLKQAVK